LGEGQGTDPKSTGFGGDLPGVRRVRPRLHERDDKWVQLVSGWRLGLGTDSEKEVNRPWAASLAGLIRFPSAYSDFPNFFSFFFSVFFITLLKQLPFEF
jgi:hypothetical protein